MTAVELAKSVARMREAQRKYFRTRSQGDLNESKRLEKALDIAVADLLRQPSLFDQTAAKNGEGKP